MVSKNILFIFCSIFFLIWIFINNLTKELQTWLLVLLILVVLFLCYYLIYKRFLIVFVISILWLLLWFLISQNNIENINKKENILKKYYNNKKYEIIFKIWNIHKIDNSNIEYNSKLLKIWNNKVKSKIYANIKITKNNKLKKWNILKTNTKLYEIKDFDNFSYKKYMLSKNIYFKSNIYDFKIIDNIELYKIEKYIIKIRNKFLNSIYKIYPKEEAIFLGWILIWARENLPNNLKQDFNNSWLTHFIAVSWFNITILILFISYIIKYFPILLRIIFITFSIIFFTILVWDTAPVIRASIMWLIWYYILISWRQWNILAMILFTLIIMVIISPFSLNYDISLHLSFLAVLWIVYTQNFFNKLFNFLPNFLEIRTAFTLTLSALVFTLPIMIFNFGQVSILAPVANIAVTWTIPLAMLFGFISVIVHFVYPFGWIIIWYITWIFLKWDIIVLHFFWKLEWSILKINLWIYKYHLEILYFIIIIFLIIWFKQKKGQN